MKMLSAFPTPFPNELLGSILLRYHELYGAEHLQKTLYDHLKLGRGVITHLPTGMESFFQRTKAIWPTGVDSILEQHTTWPLYRPFLTSTTASKAYRRIIHGPPGGLQLTLGDTTSRLKIQPVLKVCPECLIEDEKQYGRPYLHTGHHLPGVKGCSLHELSLVNVHNPLDIYYGLEWFNPKNGQVTYNKADVGSITFANLAERLRSSHTGTLGSDEVASAYRERLITLGLLTRAGHIRSKALADLVISHFSSNYLNLIGVSKDSLSHWMQSILHRTHCSHHPVKHLLYIGALYGDVTNFLRALPQRELNFSQPQKKPHCERNIEKDVILRLEHNRESLRKLAKALGISTITCVTYAKRAGFSVSIRPKRLTSMLIEGIESSAKNGTQISNICASFNVSVSTVYRVIKANPKIGRIRKKTLENAQRRKYRATWKRAVSRGSATIVRDLKESAPAAYIWLYRHDRSWLVENAMRLSKEADRCSQ